MFLLFLLHVYFGIFQTDGSLCDLIPFCLCEGLDPAEPYFQDTDASVRLDTSDAAFVDVIHTDALPFDSKLGLYIYQC